MRRHVSSSAVINFRRYHKFAVLLAAPFLFSLMVGCSKFKPFDPASLTFLIESSPANLDPRYSTDAQSAHIDALLFNSLVIRDEQMNFHGDLAESWETPDALTYIFHLRGGVRFHDGRPLTSADVKATFDFILNPANQSPKRGGFKVLSSVEAANPSTVIFHLKSPYASLLFNLIPSAVGIVPANAGPDFSRHPIGSGPFQFVSLQQDDEVIVERNPNYFRGAPVLERVRFRVVPDAIVRALELRKGSADLEMSSLSADMIPVLARQPALTITERAGTNFAYLGLNMVDPILAHREVRQALAFATDRKSLVQYLLHGQAQLASGVLPPNHWAYEPNVAQYPYDLARAETLLDAAGFPRKSNGIRFHLALKCSTEEQARLVGAALQQQWRNAGIELEIRPLELATLFSDVAKGNFQLSYAKWVGANNDPDFFDFVFSSKRFPPDGANRGHFHDPRVDALIEQIRAQMDQQKRKEECSEVQKILAEEVPYINLWFSDVISVHRRELGALPLSPTGDFDFLAAPRAETSVTSPAYFRSSK